MTFAPATILALRTYLHGEAGIPYVSLGIVGDTAHQAKGTSYHLGADKLSATAYSRRTARDRAGLTNAASAIDIGRFSASNGGYPGLRKFSVWLVDHCRRNGAGTRDIREVIYSPDGSHVWRWDRERGVTSRPREEGDDSHLTHTHVSFYRDSQGRAKIPTFRPYFAPTSPEDPMDAFGIPQYPSIATSKVATKLYPTSALTGTAVSIPAGHTKRYIGHPAGNEAVAIIGHDRDSSVEGKSALYGKAADWNIRETP